MSTATSSTPAAVSASSTWQTIGRLAIRCSDVARVASSQGPVDLVVGGIMITPLLNTHIKRLEQAAARTRVWPSHPKAVKYRQVRNRP